MKKNSDKKKSVTNSVDSRIGAFGLEPPRVYHDNGRGMQNNRQDISKNKSISNTEKREKQNKKRKKKKRLRKFILITVLIVLAVAAIIVPSLTVFFTIDTINVSGSKVYSPSQIKSVCTIDMGDNLWLSDTGKAVSKLKESMPYVYTAAIKRKLPGTINITVTDAVPAFAIDTGSSTFILLDDNFKVLENTSADSRSAVMITSTAVKEAQPGKEIVFQDSKQSACLKKLAQAVKDYSFNEATSLYSEGLNKNYIVYDNRIVFNLGSTDDLENKIYQGLAACEKLNETNPEAKGEIGFSGDKEIYFTSE